MLESKEIYSQENLVQNGSFEEIYSCYGTVAGLGFDVFEWSGCDNWTNPIKSSSDLWCSNPVVGNIYPPEIQGAGFQYPKSGNNMAGILISGTVGYENYKEYIQNQLLRTLEKNKTYELKYHVNRANKDEFTCNLSNIGANFSSSKIFNQSAYWLDSIGYSVKNLKTNYLSDTLDWVEIKLIYTANGDENYVTIGSFNSTYVNDIDFSNFCDTAGYGFTGGYFFIDDVSLIEIPLVVSFPNIFTPNNDGINDIWQPEIISGGNWECTILNRWGNIISIIDFKHPNFDGQNLSSGTYFYRFTIKNLPNESRSGFFQLIK